MLYDVLYLIDYSYYYCYYCYYYGYYYEGANVYYFSTDEVYISANTLAPVSIMSCSPSKAEILNDTIPGKSSFGFPFFFATFNRKFSGLQTKCKS